MSCFLLDCSPRPRPDANTHFPSIAVREKMAEMPRRPQHLEFLCPSGLGEPCEFTHQARSRGMLGILQHTHTHPRMFDDLNNPQTYIEQMIVLLFVLIRMCLVGRMWHASHLCFYRDRWI